MILHGTNTVMGMIFPLISFPYVSKTIGVENIGGYTFASSIVLYFLLFAKLGIPDYAIREGAIHREERETFQKFADEIFTLNILSMIISYICLAICLLSISKLSKYNCLILILSIQILCKTIGIEWVYSIYEDYVYVTVRNIASQFFSLILLFLLVHNETDVNRYAYITAISCSGSSIFNYFHATQYCKVHFRLQSDWKRHVKPVMTMFVISMATTVFENSDVTMLGVLKSDYHVGLYSVATKIYTILKTLLASIIIVSIPRLSMFWGKDEKKQFILTAVDIYECLLTFLMPAVVGIILLRKEIVLLISNITYIKAESSLLLLCIAMIFNLCGYFWARCILVPLKKEKFVFKATILSAIVNVVLNLVLIPYWAENAAAFTTVLSEILYFFLCVREGKKNLHLNLHLKDFIRIIAGCIFIALIIFVLRKCNIDFVIFVVMAIAVSGSGYIVSQILLKNNAILNILHSIKGRIHFND